jgi:hypothetical protein
MASLPTSKKPPVFIGVEKPYRLENLKGPSLNPVTLFLLS